MISVLGSIKSIRKKMLRLLDRSYFNDRLDPIDLTHVLESLKIHISNFNGFQDQSASSTVDLPELQRRDAAAPR